MLNDIYQSIDPVLFAFGPFTVRWYGVAYVLGFVFAGLVSGASRAAGACAWMRIHC